jgi:hypothetical protein
MRISVISARINRIVYHIILPAIVPVLFLIVALTPVDVLGCRLRGLIALFIAFISALAALGATIVGAKARVRHDQNAIWWVTTTIILVTPAIAIIILA